MIIPANVKHIPTTQETIRLYAEPMTKFITAATGGQKI